MKGITHFVSAIAASTFIPQVVRMSISSRIDIEGAASSMIMVLAGIYGIMPDTLDFKFGQYFVIPDYIVDPDPLNPDPQAMADTFAEAVKKAAETGKNIKIQFFPTQLGANRWRQYCIIFEEKKVHIQFNEIVSTSQIPIINSAPEGNRTGTAEFNYKLKPVSNDIDWLNRLVRFIRHTIKKKNPVKSLVKPSTIDILSSTMFALKLEDDGEIYFDWLPWHRTWSHSYVFGLILTVPIFLMTYFFNLKYWWLYGTVAFIGFAVHITEDMTGHIGGSLLWPLLKPRTEGLELFKASNPSTNFSIIYTAFVLIIWNIDRFTTQYLTGGHSSLMEHWFFLLIALVIPLIIYFSIISYIKSRIKKG